jgi:hypothetical protein
MCIPHHYLFLLLLFSLSDLCFVFSFNSFRIIHPIFILVCFYILLINCWILLIVINNQMLLNYVVSHYCSFNIFSFNYLSIYYHFKLIINNLHFNNRNFLKIHFHFHFKNLYYSILIFIIIIKYYLSFYSPIIIVIINNPYYSKIA